MCFSGRGTYHVNAIDPEVLEGGMADDTVDAESHEGGSEEC